MTLVYDVPLLRAEQEVELAHAIEAGLLAAEKLATRTVRDPQLVMDLHRLVRLGRDANERFVLANLRLVEFWARRRWLAGANGGLSLEDLVAEGMVGLVHAVEMFDFTLGWKFSTYASWWIRQKQQRASARNTAATIPHHVLQQLAELHAVREDLTDQLRRAPDEAEVAAALRTTRQHVRELGFIERRAVSLDQQLGRVSGQSRATLGDLLPDASADVDAEVCDLDLSREVRRLLQGLTSREQRVLSLRFGLAGHEPHTVDETARVLGVPAALVRDALTGALGKLRAHDDVEALHIFLEAA